LPKKLRVAVLFGGRSGEHEVSLMSARSVIEAIDRERFEVVPIAITREGRWILPHDPARLLEEGPRRGVRESDGRPVALAGDPQCKEPVLLDGAGTAAGPAGTGPIDVVFPVLHGPFGEDGTVQGLLEMAGIPYVGAGVLASAVGMDKAVMKELFRARGLPVVPFVVLTARRWREDPAGVIDEIERALGYPCFTKPANLGSSVGVRKCRDRQQLREGLELAASYDRKIIVEKGIEARELEVSVLGNEEPTASLPGEIRPRAEFYSYEAKYSRGGSELLIPAPVPERVVRELQRLAIAAFQAIDCAGMARIDFFLERSTGRLFVNEINTIPGFTSLSMYPKLWEVSGIPYRDLITRLIELALERHAERARLRTSYHRDDG